MKVAALSLGLFAAGALASSNDNSKCKCFLDDTCWPSSREWSQLNQTVSGRLIATTPLTEAGHGKASTRPLVPISSLSGSPRTSIMAPFFANQSLDPFTAAPKPCTLGNYVRYAVDVSSANDVNATIKFAKAKNIHFVIRNTGYGYLGRLTGAGAISTRNDKNYRDTAVKIGAGVQGYEILAAAKAKDVPGTVGAATVSFFISNNPTDTFYAGIDAFHAAPGHVYLSRHRVCQLLRPLQHVLRPPADWKMAANQKFMTDDIMQFIEKVTPSSGAYMNEADFQQPNF
ncbi:hypothetical protein B0T26DRAFT_765321 [Lasiosphaeria miniovina]|uniref:FAD linked oxidase N-terminal domain-containing protein n=1 Tax=Lasiosphaeria miniovina TaxID=1954250 RepID=A0AA40B4C8_9PEZI|nr:uncharacterized protein B0T26DRAFT_765321 [Lasiosphaeria miniovina]KAK0727422.1 hypothetical protein B0T26DRAFT_765321 [Lasiosphaeria miniovina]